MFATGITVSGGFECGTPTNPYTGKFVIDLTGQKPADTSSLTYGVGIKGLAAVGGGVIDLHGATLVSWSRLAVTANPGATTILLYNPVDWQIGMQIMITTTYGFYNYSVVDGDPLKSNEIRIIKNITGKRLIELNAPLQYKHLSEIVSYSAPNGLVGTIEKQAEVALLTRNIVIQGDAESDNQNFGGHVMITRGSRGYASGIELFRLGQQGVLARYPWHWHNVDDCPGQYIRNSTIHNSYQRCVTIHGTNYVSVSSNACFNFTGHGYFLEDGIEFGNTIDGNLGVLNNPVTIQANLLTLGDGDITFRGPFNPATLARSVYGPGVFWISNPNNTITNNVAAASSTTGFWYQPQLFNLSWYDPAAHTCPYHKEPERACPWSGPAQPWNAPFGKFENNMAHSMMQGWSDCMDPGGPNGQLTYSSGFGADYHNLKIWGVSLGIWPCGATLQKMSNLTIMEAILFMQNPVYVNFSNTVLINYHDQRVPTVTQGIRLYDSGWEMHKALFINFDDNATGGLFVGSIGTYYHTARISDVVLQNSRSVYFDLGGQDENPPRGEFYIPGLQAEWSCGVLDLDGSLTGAQEEATLVANTPIARDDRCVKSNGGAAFYGYACPARYHGFYCY
eukprot:Phypoly_transcript_01402.p1 GENE.Phypoly_transcript_01402~~Phypoly_transcript_01402.p1  ORF type:complete len:620 (+),score=52.01 Phypoly_transcript_01402:781-2640(+)